MHTATAFPLVQLPQRIVFVDDNASWLQAVRQYVATEERRLFFEQPAVALQALQRGQAAWDNVRDLMYAYTSTDRAQLLTNVAAGYFNHGARFRLNTVVVLDYAMPGMNGMELAQSIKHIAGTKLLLTGEVGPGLAVEAFNADLIHAYRPKARCRESMVFERLLQELHQRTCHDFGAVLEAGTTREHLQLLRHPRVAAALWAHSQALGWYEHVVIEEPFGVLGLGRSGALQWVQIETPASMAALGGAGRDTERDAGDPMSADADAMGNNVGTRLAARAQALSTRLGCHGLLPQQPEVALCDDPPLWASTWELPLPVLTSATWGHEADHGEGDQARTLAAQLGAAHRHRVRVHGAPADSALLLQRARQSADDTLRQAQALARQWSAQCAPSARAALQRAALAEGVVIDARAPA